MNKILLVESNNLLKSMYKLNFEMYLGITAVTCVDSAIDAISYLSENKVDLILSKNSIKTEDTSNIMESYLAEKVIETPLVIIGKRDMFSFGAYFVESSIDIKKLLKIMSSILSISAKDMARKKVDLFIKFSKEMLNDIYWINIDLYNTNQEIIIKKDSLITPIVVATNVTEDFVFVNKADRLRLADHYTNEIIGKLKTDDFPTKEQALLGELLCDELSIRVSKFGITPSTIEYSKKALKNIESLSLKTSSLKLIVTDLLEQKGSYRYSHMVISSFISIHILRQMEWCNPEQENKMMFAAFFQNIYLNEDKLVKINSNEELRNANLNEMEKNLVHNHANKSAELVSQIGKIPLGVDSIIRNHHGALNGIGFAEFYGGSLAPLSLIFIIAEQFTHLILDEDNEFNFNKAIIEIRNKFPSKRFAKIISAITEVKKNIG